MSNGLAGLAYCASCVQEATKRQGLGGLGVFAPVTESDTSPAGAIASGRRGQGYGELEPVFRRERNFSRDPWDRRALNGFDPVAGNRNYPLDRFDVESLRGFGLSDDEIDAKLAKQYGASGGGSSDSGSVWSFLSGGSSSAAAPSGAQGGSSFWQDLFKGAAAGGVQALTGQQKTVVVKDTGFPWGTALAVGGGALLLVLVLRHKGA
jgi:hypothetical protein